MADPLVSIVLPAYEAHAVIGPALLSVVAQSFGDFELIVVDDGSRDAEATEREISAFRDARMRMLRLPRNVGVAAALNAGIAQARGRFLARMDADDEMLPTRLAEQMRHLLAERLAFGGAGASKFGAETGSIMNPLRQADIRDTFLCGNPFLHPTVMFDRARLSAFPRYDEAFACEEDYELWSRLILHEPCGNLDVALLRYRVGAGNADHPAKPVLNRAALTRFATAAGIEAQCPIDALSEFQMTGFVDAPNFQALREYARRADDTGAPKLGWLHGLLDAPDYAAFFDRLDARSGFVALDEDRDG